MRRVGHITTIVWLDEPDDVETRYEVEVEYEPYGYPARATILREVTGTRTLDFGGTLPVYAPTARRGERLTDAEVDAHRDEWEALWTERMEEERYLQGARS